MKAGNWKLTGEPIVFAKTGRLVNGQHRLHAVVESNVPLTTVVVRGVDEDTFKVMDSGLSRSMGDLFHSAGHKSANQMASTTKHAMQYMDGVPLTDHNHMSRYNREDVLAYFEANKTMFEFANSRGVPLTRIGLPRTPAEVVAYVLYKNDYEGADYFISRLIDGAGLRPQSPILALRNYIVRLMSGSNRPTDITDYIVPTIIRCYNEWATGKRRARVTAWKAGDELPKPVPAVTRTASIK